MKRSRALRRWIWIHAYRSRIGIHCTQFTCVRLRYHIIKIELEDVALFPEVYMEYNKAPHQLELVQERLENTMGISCIAV